LHRHLQHRLKFRHLRVVDAILSHDSILQAAKALGLSQPALSKSLQEIEAVIDARLFERHSKGVTANAHGVIVGRSARRILTEVNRLEDELEALDGGDGGSVVVGALPVTAAGLLPGALARFQANYPNIQVRVSQERTEALLAALTVREVDFVIGRLYEPTRPDTFVRQPLYDESIAVLARVDHPIFDRPAIRPEDLAGYNLVLPTVSQRVGREIDVFLQAIGIEARQPLRSSSVSMIREILHATDCVAVAPQVMLIGDIVRGSVKALPVGGPQLPRPAGLIRRSDAPLMRNANAFVETFKTYVRDVHATLRA
jgi:LysR family pca operon transcriptional activator